MSKQIKKPCKYCGALTNGDVCGNCTIKSKLWRDIQTMVRNKIEEGKTKNGKQKKGDKKCL